MKIVEITDDGYVNGLRQGQVSRPWKINRLTQPERWIACLHEGGEYYSYLPKEDMIGRVRRWTREHALAYAEWLHQRMMEALPDLGTFPELRGMDQYLDDEIRGIAEGAQTTVAEVCLRRYWREVMWHACGHPPGAPGAACSEIVLFDAEGNFLVGKGWDDILTWYDPKDFPSPPREFELSLNRQADGHGYSYVATINEKGLAWEQGGGPLYLEPRPEDIRFPVPMVDLLLRHCATADEVVELMTRYEDYWGPCNAVAVDAEGNTALFEKSWSRLHLTRARGQPMFTTYGGCETPEMQELVDTSGGLFSFYRGRMERMAEIAERDKGCSNVQTLWDMMLDHHPDGIGSTCQHRENRPPGVELFCMGAFALLPAEGRYLRRTISFEDGRIRYACQNPPSEGRFTWS